MFFCLTGLCLIVVTKKPSMKELTKKERKNVRKTMKTNFDQINRSKKIWEELRRYVLLSHEVESGSNITPCNKIDSNTPRL